MPRIILSRAAQRDLSEIIEYGEAEFGAAAADAYNDEIEERFERLVDHPLIGEAKDSWGEGVRQLPCNRHRIIYRVLGNTVRIIRILHHSRDVQKHLKP
ncbi:type II toxin-antitoxin system RelE/ParE family toxin [Novosphingobium taihuense]|uniref:Toxin n=1 Tax=Novosphingobium taihuense TaxID=260085 RepID=A0A7W7ACY2_9SPHN|nr:type II toxin-antitoxin system RelE/ParE family toxin [Novosphingobium taihuense]MBB4614743.1 toxin ParE1/3/4 [Novosphingobium taihuense]